MMMSITLKHFMMFLIFTMMVMIISSTLMNYMHPLMLILMLLIFTIMNLLLMFSLTSFSMYMYMIFISIVGGMMIMFLYFTSMINNYPSKIKFNEIIMIMFMIMFIILIMMTYNTATMNNLEFFTNHSYKENKIFIYKIYIYPLSFFTTLTILNLLYCLILTMKMCSSKYLPLKKIDYENI